jgi:hypothetical protein
MLRSRFTSRALSFAFLTVLVSCDGQSTGLRRGEATLSITANLSGTMVATIVADVTAPDIPTMLTFNIPIDNGTAAGTITVPAGSNRTIALRAYDAGGVETHNGSVTVTILPGTNPSMAILLTPLTGDLPITVTLGSVSVTVTPPSATLSVAGTAQLSATILDSQGHPTTGVVAWATHHPGIATVDATGLVTATGVGTTTISAVFRGVTGTATITVNP